MPSRSYDWRTLDKVVMKYKDTWVGFDAEQIVEDEDNILITDGNDNFGLFEFEEPGIYYGHYMFTERGPNTLSIAREILSFLFREFPVKAVLGLTPVEHRGALRLNKQLGFTFHDIINTEAGPHYQVSLKKEDFKHE